jgi:predicted AAA+ superfamily ATPase
MADIETNKREVNALLQLAKRMKTKQMLIITRDEESRIVENGITIEVVPIWKWLRG